MFSIVYGKDNITVKFFFKQHKKILDPHPWIIETLKPDDPRPQGPKELKERFCVFIKLLVVLMLL